MLSIPFHLSYNAKKALVKGIVIGFVTLIAYLAIVIVTTPSLHPFLAIKAAFAMNSVIIFGMTIGIGLQFFISSYRKGLGYCKLDSKKRGNDDSKRVLSGSAIRSSSATAISSFFSFFSLLPLGCCGSWLLILSFLPSIFGSSLSIVLIHYSKPLSYIGLAIVLGSAALSAFKLQRELKQVEKAKKVFKISKSRNPGFVLELFNNKKSALVIATSIIIVISVMIVTMVNNARISSIDFSSSHPSSNANLLDKVNSLPSSSLLIGQSNAQKEELQKHIIPLDQIVSGGPPPDGIPYIDNPKFLTVQEAGKNFLSDSDLVLGLNIHGDIRAYPLSILVWHEIVNDKVGGVPVAVTYCPLCFTNQVFNSTIGSNQILQFGTSGKLYNSNLVMYDRGSKSLWSQALGQAIVGKYAGQKLQRIPFDIAYWKDWKQLYPNSKILSKDTGFSRPYGADPYGDYYTSNQLYFPVSNHDNRLELKEKIVGLDNGDGIGKGQYKAYKLQQIETQKIINDDIGGEPVTLFSLHPAMVRVYDRIITGGKILEFEYKNSNNKITDKQTGTEWNFDGEAVNGTLKGTHLTRLPFDEGFWFEWVAFHPRTALYPS
jgi:Protein of unknown function (DUF3179)